MKSIIVCPTIEVLELLGRNRIHWESDFDVAVKYMITQGQGKLILEFYLHRIFKVIRHNETKALLSNSFLLIIKEALTHSFLSTQLGLEVG